MIAMNADFLGQLLLDAALEVRIVGRVRGVGAGIPVAIADLPPMPQRQFSDQNSIPI